MDKLKKQLLAMPLRTAIRRIFFLTFFFDCIAASIVYFQANKVQNRILEQKALLVSETGTLRYEPFTAGEAAIYYGCYAAMAIVPVCVLIFTIACSAGLLYRVKLHQPFLELQSAIANIAADDLDFTISYQSSDELGNLCQSMERMRRELYASKQKTWELLEQRRLLNASTAHDLRTPVTVLKGYLDYLKQDAADKLSNEGIRTAVLGMDDAVIRLEQYIDCMQHLDRMEHINVQKKPENTAKLIQELQRCISRLSDLKKIELSSSILQTKLDLDKSLFFRIAENLVQNALRYATSNITIALWVEGDFFLIRVKDDGCGFAQADLHHAADFFYTTENSGHWGIGLTICRILCEKQEGTLLIENNSTGGACVTASIKIQ